MTNPPPQPPPTLTPPSLTPPTPRGGVCSGGWGGSFPHIPETADSGAPQHVILTPNTWIPRISRCHSASALPHLQLAHSPGPPLGAAFFAKTMRFPPFPGGERAKKNIYRERPPGLSAWGKRQRGAEVFVAETEGVSARFVRAAIFFLSSGAPPECADTYGHHSGHFGPSRAVRRGFTSALPLFYLCYW